MTTKYLQFVRTMFPFRPGSEDAHVYRLLVVIWTLVGLAWFAGIVKTIQANFERGLDHRKVSLYRFTDNPIIHM